MNCLNLLYKHRSTTGIRIPIRFSLCTLLLMSLLAGSAAMLYRCWDPWVAAFAMPDGKRIWTLSADAIRVWEPRRSGGRLEILMRAEFWATAALAVLMLRSLWRDLRCLRCKSAA